MPPESSWFLVTIGYQSCPSMMFPLIRVFDTYFLLMEYGRLNHWVGGPSKHNVYISVKCSEWSALFQDWNKIYFVYFCLYLSFIKHWYTLRNLTLYLNGMDSYINLVLRWAFAGNTSLDKFIIFEYYYIFTFWILL